MVGVGVCVCSQLCLLTAQLLSPGKTSQSCRAAGRTLRGAGTAQPATVRTVTVQMALQTSGGNRESPGGRRGHRPYGSLMNLIF